MGTRIKKKDGFSISEMLMVVLILSLIIVVLGSGVMVVKNAYEKITVKAEAQTLLSTTITKVTDEFRFSKYIKDDGTDPVKFTSGNQGYEIWFENGDDTKGNRGILMCANGGGSVQLLTDKTMTSRLTPKMTYSYDKTDNLFFATITIAYKDNEEYLKQEIKVKPIN